MNSGMKKRKPTIPGMSGSNAIQNSILFNHMSHHYRFVYGAEKHVDSSPPDCLKRTVHRKNSIAQRPAKISAFHAECSTENQSPQLKAQTVGLKTRYMGKTTQLNCSGTFCQASVIPCPKRKGAESSDRQKQKFSSPQKPFEPRILHNDAQSKLRTMKVYHPPRKRSQPSAQSSRDTSSDSPQQQQDSSPVQQLQESSPVQQLQEAPPVQQVQKPSPLEKIAKQKQTTYKCKQNTSHKSTHQKHKCQEQSQELVSKASHHCNQQLSDSSQHSPQQQAQKKKRQAWLSRSKSSSKQKKLSSQEIQKQPLREETHNQDEQEDEALSSTASSGPWQTPYAENSSSPGTTAKSESKVSSRDSAYNGGISSGGESRGPTPEHKCDSTKCRSRVLLTAAKAGFTGCKLGLPQNEESMYVQFVHDITQDILLRGSYSNSSLQQLFQKHINQNKNQLNLDRMNEEVANLQVQLDMTPDEDEETSISLSSLTLEDLQQICKEKSGTVKLIDGTFTMTDHQIISTLVEMGFEPEMAKEICQTLSEEDFCIESDVSIHQLGTQTKIDLYAVKETSHTTQMDTEVKRTLEEIKKEKSEPVCTSSHQSTVLSDSDGQEKLDTKQSYSKPCQCTMLKVTDTKVKKWNSKKLPALEVQQLGSKNVEDSGQVSSCICSKLGQLCSCKSYSCEHQFSELQQISEQITKQESFELSESDKQKLAQLDKSHDSTCDVNSLLYASQSQKEMNPGFGTERRCGSGEMDKLSKCKSMHQEKRLPPSQERSSSSPTDVPFTFDQKSTVRESIESSQSDEQSYDRTSQIQSKLSDILSSYSQNSKNELNVYQEQVKEEEMVMGEEVVPEHISSGSSSSLFEEISSIESNIIGQQALPEEETNNLPKL